MAHGLSLKLREIKVVKKTYVPLNRKTSKETEDRLVTLPGRREPLFYQDTGKGLRRIP